jgi:hypothetical protein
MGARLQPLVDHPLRLGRHQIEQGVTAHVDQAAGSQEGLDLFPGSPAEERQPIADRVVSN